jgi:hypothetical protein
MSANMPDHKLESVDPGFELEVDSWNRLVLTFPDGTQHLDVDPVRAFPITRPEEFVAFRDSAGNELLLIERLDALPQALKETILAALSDREFLPVVKRIVKLRSQVFPAEMDVETDRGPISLKISSEEDVRRLGAAKAVITDSMGMNYLIPDLRKLDRVSRRHLERFV